MDTIKLFDQKKDCCGCGACENICPKESIKMVADKEGFFFPIIDHGKCIKCGQCLKVCPLKSKESNVKSEQNRPHIKIINYSMDENYGAIIAGACLESTIKSIVSDDKIVQTINYDKFNDCDNTLTKILSLFIRILSYIKAIIKRKPLPSGSAHYKPYYSPSDLEKKHRYNDFSDSFLSFTKRMTNIDLKNDPDNNVALICGSDVIWDPERILTGLSTGFYLNFGHRKTRRISYAASLDYINSRKLYLRWPLYRHYLRKLNYISIREKDNLKFIQSTSTKKVVQCCDPVFLYEASDFEKMIETSHETPDSNYIYAYILMRNDFAVNYINKLAKEKNMKIYYYAPEYTDGDFGENAYNCMTDGPAEFLMRLKHADYIVTTSFHCVAFSLIFEKQFLSFTRSTTGNKISDLLSYYNLSERLTVDTINCDIDKKIDYNSVDLKMKEIRKNSLKFLNESLSDI